MAQTNKDDVAVLLSEKVDLKVMNTAKDKKRKFHNYKMIIYQDYKFLYVFAATNKDTRFLKQKLVAIKGNIEKFILMVGGFNIHL